MADWRGQLPTLMSRDVTLREPEASDSGALVDLLSIADASRFLADDEVTEPAVRRFIERSQRERTSGLSFTFVVLPGSVSGPTTLLRDTSAIAGLMQVRQLDPAFECGECDATFLPSARGTGLFQRAARLVGSFAFDIVGAHRLEVRVRLENGRANGALRKLGAVQEGILRRAMRRGGDYTDQVLWSVLKDDWSDRAPMHEVRVH
jgi:RimJ/RimL family protein N-acetyltransferase